MKNILPILAALLAALQLSCGSVAGGAFEIAVSAPGCNNLTVKLCRELDSGLAVIDSQKVEMSRVRLKGIAPAAELMYIFVESADDYLPIFVESGRMNVELNLAKPAKSVVSGSESDRIFKDFLQSYSVYSDKEAGYSRMARNAAINNDSMMLLGLDSAFISIRKEAIEFQRMFAKKYIRHPIACYILGAHLMYGLSRSELSQMLDSIPEPCRGCRYYKMAEDRLSLLQQYGSDPSLAEYERIAAALRCGPGDVSALICKAAKMLMGKPYAAGTLDSGAQERLSASLTRFDCVTFQETCLALARDAMDSEPGFGNFLRRLEDIRYRNGKCDGYASRLHYSTDWIISNIKKGYAADLTQALGGVRMSGQINFMSQHASRYKALAGNPALADSIAMRELYLNGQRTLYIPKGQIDSKAEQIPSGALIFIATSVPGLDYMHVGLAIHEDGKLRLMHASSTLIEVTTTQESLQEFLMTLSKATGITVLKPL